MRRRSLRTPLAVLASTTLALTLTGPPLAGAAPDEGDVAVDDPAPVPAPTGEQPESASGLWIVQLEEPPLARYDGGVDGLAATSPRVTGEEQLDVAAPESRDYLRHLAELQEETGLQIEDLLGRDIAVEETYSYAVNGMALRVSAEEAGAIADLPGVAAVEPDQVWQPETDVSNDLIHTPTVWAGETGTGVGTRGEGVLVGMLDTGVNPDHPSFAAEDGDGYVHENPFGSGTYLGVCADPEATTYEDICNDKLVGAYNFTSDRTARDGNGHGSHTGSTMAGNKHTAVFAVGADEYQLTVQGVAPRANVISYKVCTDFGCLSTASVSAVEQAIADGTDVLNYSISGPDNPWNNAVDAAFLSAYEAGIFVSASAGNDGPGAGTVAKTAPWNAAVAATNSPRLIAHDVSVTAPAPVPDEVTGLAGVPGTGPGVTAPVSGELREASVADPGNIRGCEPFPAGAFDGAIALIERGDCNFSVKVDHAEDAGALAVVVANQFEGPPVVMGALESTGIPAVMVAKEEGVTLRDFVVAHPGTQVTVDSGTVLTTTDAWSRMVTDFSSRGPSDFDLLAPTYAAPGRNILAATAAAGDDAVRYEFMQGTSMAAPHGAGAAALLHALHGDWSPAMIRSALASTADDEGLLKDDGLTPADPFDVGSGLLDLDAAGRVGLVMDESHEDFVAANPATGGDPTTLNLPAFVDQNCLEVCTFTREVTSVADATATYSASVTAPEGVTLTVEPTEFTLEPGATQQITLTADVGSLVGGDHLFGELRLDTDATHANDTEVSDVHYPVVLVKGEAEIVVTPGELSSTLGVDEQAGHVLTVGNTGGADMEWALTEEGEGCALPAWLTVDPTSGGILAGASQEVSVTLDSAGMAGGAYDATVCLASNDPHTPVAGVAVTLEVVEIPVVAVDTPEASAAQPGGTVTSTTLTVGNTGYGVLNWTLADPEAGPSDERIAQLRDGVLLVPNSTTATRGVMAFDAEDGTLLDPSFIPHENFGDSSLYTPKKVLPKLDGTGFLLSDQVQHVITEYDLDGNFLGFFAPTRDGEDRTIMQNVRGMAWSPEDTLVVAVASGENGGSLVQFDQDGTYLGRYAEKGLGGLSGPWDVLFRDDDLLVADSTAKQILSLAADGSSAHDPFVDRINWPEQLAETPEGTVLTANWSTSSSTDFGRGVQEFSADGEHLAEFTVDGATSFAGVHPLGNGNILATTEDGVVEIDRASGDATFEQVGGRGHFVTEVRLPDLMPCVTPDEVSWLSAEPASGEAARGEVDEVTLYLDSTGLEPGDHTAQLCVSSDDPATPYVPVPVTLTVTDATCDTTVTDQHAGALTVSGELACLAAGSRVDGPVTVSGGGGLFADDATVAGPVTARRAGAVEVTDSELLGPVTARQVDGALLLDGNAIGGSVTLQANSTGERAILVAENTVGGVLTCRQNTPPPTNDGRPNTVNGVRTGQCADL